MESYVITKDTLEKIMALKLPEKQENNQYLLLHVYGDGIRASETFNAKIYTGKKGLKLVTNDYATLIDLIENKNSRPEKTERTIDIDDSGVGMPIGGTLVGIYDSLTNKIYYGEVDVMFYQNPLFEEKGYLDEAARVALKILSVLNIDKKATLIRICAGHVNLKIKEKLREEGFFVEVAKIGEPLQSGLEKKHKEYIENKFGYSGYYDPKETDNISSKFNGVIAWINQDPSRRLQFAKIGWEFFNKL